MSRGHLDNHAHDKEEQKVIQAVGKVTHNQAGDGLLAPGLVVEDAGHPAKQDGQGDRNQHSQQQAADAAQAEEAHEDNADLPGHGADNDAEVQAKAGDHGDNQGDDQQAVSVQPPGQLA